MAIERLTIPKTVVAKLATQLGKPDNAKLLEESRTIRATKSPSGDAIWWEPPKEIIKKLADVLRREETFIRKKGSCSHKMLVNTIKQLDEYGNGEG